MIWIKCLRCEKFQRDFVAWTFALIAPVQLDLHRVSCSNEMVSNARKHYEIYQNMSLGSNSMVPNAPKHYETHQNMSLGFNGMDRVPSLRKIPTRLCCTNFSINCTRSARFAPSLTQWWNGPKCTQTLRNAPEHEFRVQWHGSDTFVAKNSDATALHEHVFGQFCNEFYGVMKHSQMHPNITKCTRTWV